MVGSSGALHRAEQITRQDDDPGQCLSDQEAAQRGWLGDQRQHQREASQRREVHAVRRPQERAGGHRSEMVSMSGIEWSTGCVVPSAGWRRPGQARSAVRTATTVPPPHRPGSARSGRGRARRRSAARAAAPGRRGRNGRRRRAGVRGPGCPRRVARPRWRRRGGRRTGEHDARHDRGDAAGGLRGQRGQRGGPGQYGQPPGTPSQAAPVLPGQGRWGGQRRPRP